MDDLGQLRLLSILHYVLGGLTAICACIPFIHLGIGIAIVTGALPAQQGDAAPPVAFGWVFIVVAALLIVIGWTFAICLILAGRFLQQRRAYQFCFVVAGFSCLNMPFGTCLGIFTIVVLCRPSVKVLFKQGKPGMPASDFAY